MEGILSFFSQFTWWEIFLLTTLIAVFIWKKKNILWTSNLRSIAIHPQKIRRFLPFVELLAWFVFAFWLINRLFGGEVWTQWLAGGSLGVILLGGSWFVLRDVVAGIILKTEDLYRLHEWVKVKDIDGKIIKIGYCSIELETQHGERVKIPYRLLARESRFQSHPAPEAQGHHFQIACAKEETVAILIERIYESVSSVPWSSVKKPAQVHLAHEAADHYVFDIHVFPIFAQYSQQIADHLKKNLRLLELELLANES